MVNVAVAGGTGAMGRTILEAIKGNTRHRAVVLSRKTSKSEELQDTPSLPVDYGNVDGLKRTLEENDIHTIVAAFAISGDSLSKSQINLIKAASLSSTTKRFIPSSFAIPYPRSFIDALPPLKPYFDSLDKLRQTDLEWTVFLNGIFLDYFGMPYVKTFISPSVLIVDMANKAAAIPGDGTAPITLTYSFDVARLLVAALDLERWKPESRVVGETTTWNAFVRVAEEVRGAKFDIIYDDIDKLKRGEITELPGHVLSYAKFPKPAFQSFFAIFEQWMTDGTSEIKREGSLNEQFPNIKPMTIRQLLQHWEGK